MVRICKDDVGGALCVRIKPDSDIIIDAFRWDNSGLDSGLKQGHRCVNEHVYE